MWLSPPLKFRLYQSAPSLRCAIPEEAASDTARRINDGVPPGSEACSLDADAVAECRLPVPRSIVSARNERACVVISVGDEVGASCCRSRSPAVLSPSARFQRRFAPSRPRTDALWPDAVLLQEQGRPGRGNRQRANHGVAASDLGTPWWPPRSWITRPPRVPSWQLPPAGTLPAAGGVWRITALPASAGSVLPQEHTRCQMSIGKVGRAGREQRHPACGRRHRCRTRRAPSSDAPFHPCTGDAGRRVAVPCPASLRASA